MAIETRNGPGFAFYVYHGEEEFFLDRGLLAARHWPNRTITYIDASEGLDDITLVETLESIQMDDSARTIIVDEAQKLKETKSKVLRKYVDEKSPGDLSVVLVAIARSDKLAEVWSYTGARGKLSEHKPFLAWAQRPPKGKEDRERERKRRPWIFKEGDSEHHQWLEYEAERVGLKLDVGVGAWVAQMTGGDLYRIRNELRKLLLLVGPHGKVTMGQAMSVTAITPTAEPRDVVEAAFGKNLKGAMNALSLLYKAGDEASVRITYGLMREAQKMLAARHLLDKGSSDDEIAAAVGMHPYRCKLTFLPNVRKHDQTSLIRAMRRLCKLDLEVKGASSSKRTLVELTVLSIAG